MGLKVGDKAPELLGVNENGEEIRLSSYKSFGKVRHNVRRVFCLFHL